ncbi:metal-dependent transcriptional regulator [Pontibacter sp. G13]|uniref:metal-dependent transcriptional regulator n=1 Tax=Pontibacter sp. G13 TaxID=3074898 RepID=UPI002889B525|nr:metal-dependent transcriptional regulator [Pontibacter sp. G13]WNJ18574.1 metal-dependent transcriptional regulator [Pontibacter sp. G13]
MKHHSETEENYLKCILRHSHNGRLVSTNTIAHDLGTSAASVTDMLKKLNEKALVQYTPYKGARLSDSGEKVALRILRKHRLWEVFLVDKLNFSWDNVHDVAEQLEHVNSPELIRAIDKFLGYPKFDPHGDPIPNEAGEIVERNTHLLSEVQAGSSVTVASVLRSDPDFLQYLDRIGLSINTTFEVMETLPFDDSLQLLVSGNQVVISGNVAKNLQVFIDE